jgi:predicted heme/steroid binding protein/uncharacterized membrane protein
MILRQCALISCLLFLSSFIATISLATPEYSDRTKQGCKTCHTDPITGKLSSSGLEYAASGYVWPPEGGYRVLGPIRKSIRLIIGTIHIISAFIWFGTILYVHILLKPAYASRGLPRGEVLLGLFSMAMVGVTGGLLTISRIKSLNVLFKSPWGNLLLVKIILYLIMVLSAVFVVFFIGPKLKRSMKVSRIPEDGKFDPLTLSGFDGKENKPAFIAYKDKVYDVSSSRFWKGGVYMKHLSGQDLTDALSKAPHGEEKLEGIQVVGSYDISLKPPKTFEQKAFYFVAYTNLALVFIVLFVIAWWRWGL